MRLSAVPAEDRRVLLPIDEVSELTGVSEALLRREAPIRRIGTRTLIPRSWVESLASWAPAEVAS